MTESRKKTITVVTPCYNEEAGIRECYERTRQVFETMLPQYNYEHLFIDNCSGDRTVEVLREVAAADPRVKVIVNSRNFGLARSPYHAKLQATGDAVVPLVADLQTPPELIVEFAKKWEEGYPMVLGIRTGMEEGPVLKACRNAFYALISRLSNVEQIRHFIGFGLFDQRVIQVMRDLDDPVPYFRGIVSEIGFQKAFIEYHQPPRKHGKSRHSFFDLLELALLGLTSYSKAPLRMMTFAGVILSGISIAIALFYLVAKLLFWNSMELGLAPLLIGTFIFFSFQMLFIGLLGEYVGVIFDYVKRRPLVIEKERINFDRQDRP